MAEKEPELIVTDRRKFRFDGEPTGVKSAPEPAATDAPAPTEPEATSNVIQMPVPAPQDDATGTVSEEAAEPALNAPTAEQMHEVQAAYSASTQQLDTVIRAANPGTQPMQEMNFSRLVQSVYMTAMLQLGAVAQEGQQPRVDILGARQSVDMLGVLSEKTKGNLAPDEETLLSTALFDLRMAFLEITQAIARSAAQQQPDLKL
jgi:hypothetical protein